MAARRRSAARGHRGRDLTHFFKQSLQTRTPSLPRCSPLRSSPFASSAPHPQLKVGNNANQSTLRRLRVSATPSHFPFRERKMHMDSRLRNLSGVSSNSGGALTRPSFLCRISWSPQIPNTSLSLSVVACCFVSERGKLFFHCAVFWGRRAGAAAKATASAAATNTHATSNRPHDQTPQTQRVAFLRYTRAPAHKPRPAAELLPERESATLPYF